jgi:fumarate reductase flavoprotein subunit
MKIDVSNLISDFRADVAVIGAGGAGLAAAVAAAEKGAKVIIVEKRPTVGGNSIMAEGIFGADSPAQKRMMIDARRDDLFKIAMEYAHWKIDPRIVRAFVNKSGETIEWLERKGLRFDWIPPYYPNQVPMVWHCLQKTGAEIVRVLTQSCKDLDVKMVLGTEGSRILLNDEGEVTGILANSKEDNLRVFAVAVIIATGGYGGNKELLKKYCPSYTEEMDCVGIPHAGDGLRMAIEVGGATEGLGLLHLNGPRFPGSLHLSAVAQEPNTLWVNSKGERFTDESVSFRFERANTIDRQPGKVSYALFDEAVKKKITEEGLIKGIGILIRQRTRLTDLDKELREGADKGGVKISASWDEIALWLGVPPEVMGATVNEYNSFCDRGHDEIFAKDRQYLSPLRIPPYYAIRCHSAFLGTIGGIKINQHMEVLNKTDNPIGGLYATGVDTGGWESDTYNCILSGSTFGFAISSGRIAGERAVQYSLKKKRSFVTGC